jgi:heme A synthase
MLLLPVMTMTTSTATFLSLCAEAIAMWRGQRCVGNARRSAPVLNLLVLLLLLALVSLDIFYF